MNFEAKDIPRLSVDILDPFLAETAASCANAIQSKPAVRHIVITQTSIAAKLIGFLLEVPVVTNNDLLDMARAFNGGSLKHFIVCGQLGLTGYRLTVDNADHVVLHNTFPMYGGAIEQWIARLAADDLLRLEDAEQISYNLYRDVEAKIIDSSIKNACGLSVAFEKDIDTFETEKIARAVKQLRGVLSVTAEPVDHMSAWVASERMKDEIRQRVNDALYPKEKK